MVLFEPFMFHFTYRHVFRGELLYILKWGVLLESNKLSLCFVRSTPLPEIIIICICGHSIACLICKQKLNTVVMAIVNGYPADMDSVHAYF